MKIHLQSYGKAEAKPAKDFKVGEKMLWNFGEKSEVTAIIRETPSMIVFQLGEWQRKMKKDRLVAIG